VAEEEGKRNRVDQALHGCNQAAASHCISTVIIAGVKYSCSSRVSVSFGKMLRCASCGNIWGFFLSAVIPFKGTAATLGLPEFYYSINYMNIYRIYGDDS